MRVNVKTALCSVRIGRIIYISIEIIKCCLRWADFVHEYGERNEDTGYVEIVSGTQTTGVFTNNTAAEIANIRSSYVFHEHCLIMIINDND